MTTTIPNNLIAYFRVSTRKQERSGLGLEGQQAAVAQFAGIQNANVLAEYTEVETGKRSDRPALTKAIGHAKRARAMLVVAKLDRLARNVAFTSALMDSGIDFCCCDNPFASRLTIHVLSAVAEHEAEQISQRTKAALQAAKRRGVLLGAARVECRNLTDEARQRGSRNSAAVARREADEAYSDLREFLAALRPAFSYQQIADILNCRGERTRRGRPWTSTAVLRACRRLGIVDS